MTKRVAILTGGVGGAKLVLGAARILPAAAITAIVNTGDDFRHFGLHVSPDVDTLLYTLAGLAHPERGWGRAEETWSFMAAVGALGGEDWFQLGDGDLALHVLRTARLAAGESLTAIIADFARHWGIGASLLPMTDRPVATRLATEAGELDFQTYFVGRSCAPKVAAIRFDGADRAEPAPGVIEAIAEADTLLLAPSNPFLSIDPILSIAGIRKALAGAAAPVVAVSPLVGGKAVKGPTAKLMEELGLEITHRTIADHYRGIIDAMLIDEDGTPPDIPHQRTNTLMINLDDRARVAQAALDLADLVRRPTGQADRATLPPR